MKYKYFHIIILIVILTSNSLLAQFGEVEVTFDDRLLRNGDRQELLPLINEIEQFFEDTEWDDEYGDLQIPLHVQIIFDGTSEKGSENIYLAHSLF